MSAEQRSRDSFRWRSAGLLIGVAVCILALFRQFRVASGVVVGFALYAANLFLMLEIGRSLLRGNGSSRPKPLAAVSSTGRLLFLAIALALIAIFLGRAVVLGACGGLLIAQVNLHVPNIGQ